MAAKRKEHPLALLFWSQFFFIYALPVSLEIATRVRGAHLAPGRTAVAVATIYPVLMGAAATMTVVADFAPIYAYVIRQTRRWPSFVFGAAYAMAAFVGVALVQSGTRNVTIAWADYVAGGSTTGIIVLLLALVFEIFATTFLLCQLVWLGRRWGRLAPVAQRN